MEAYKEIKVIEESLINRPDEIPKRPDIGTTIKKVYIDGVYVGTCDTFVMEFTEVYKH